MNPFSSYSLSRTIRLVGFPELLAVANVIALGSKVSYSSIFSNQLRNISVGDSSKSFRSSPEMSYCLRISSKLTIHVYHQESI